MDIQADGEFETLGGVRFSLTLLPFQSTNMSFCSALKLRYLVALAPPDAQPSLKSPPPSQPGSPLKQQHPRFTVSQVLLAMGPPAIFDAKVIAKREEAWETMLETALERWVNAVVKEKREKPAPVPVAV